MLARLPETDRRLLPQVLDAVWGRVNLLARDGKPVYAGLIDSPATPRILPVRGAQPGAGDAGVAAAAPGDPRLPVVRTALLTLAGKGWGSTDATAAALEALAAAWQAPPTPGRRRRSPCRTAA